MFAGIAEDAKDAWEEGEYPGGAGEGGADWTEGEFGGGDVRGNVVGDGEG